MRFNAETILETFKTTKVADAPKLKHTQYLRYLAQRLGYQDYEHFKRCLKTAPSDRLGDFYTTLMKKICALRVPEEGIAHVRLSHFDGKSIGYDSYFIGWDRNGKEVRMPNPGYEQLAIMDFRTIFEEPLYVIETDAELSAWQWNWGSFAAVPVALAKANFPSLFLKEHLVVTDPPLQKIKRRIRRARKKSGLI